MRAVVESLALCGVPPAAWGALRALAALPSPTCVLAAWCVRSFGPVGAPVVSRGCKTSGSTPPVKSGLTLKESALPEASGSAAPRTAHGRRTRFTPSQETAPSVRGTLSRPKGGPFQELSTLQTGSRTFGRLATLNVPVFDRTRVRIPPDRRTQDNRVYRSSYADMCSPHALESTILRPRVCIHHLSI